MAAPEEEALPDEEADAASGGAGGGADGWEAASPSSPVTIFESLRKR
jgi:hypothetical protein